MTGLENERRVEDIFLPDFTEAFCMVSHSICVSRMERYRHDSWTMGQEDHWAQSAVVSSLKFSWRLVMSAILQCSTLGSLLFNVFINVWVVEWNASLSALLTTPLCCNQYTVGHRCHSEGLINVLIETLWSLTKESTGSCTWNMINSCEKGWMLTGQKANLQKRSGAV